MTATLIVPPPTLRFEDAGGGTAALEKPLTVLLGPVTEAGAALTPASLTTFGFNVQRRRAPGASPEVWDDASKKWITDQAGAPPAKPVALTYRAGDPFPWQGILVAAGAQDTAGAPVYVKAVGGYPVYSLRGAFTGKDGAAASGPPSASVTFVGAADRNLLVLGPGDDEKPENATQARMLLKNTGQQVIGGLTITRDNPAASVRLDNAAGASIVLNPDGSIEVRPAPGRRVVIAGDLETGHIRYLPVGSNFPQDLG